LEGLGILALVRPVRVRICVQDGVQGFGCCRETLQTRCRWPGRAVSRMRASRPEAWAKAVRPMSWPQQVQVPSRAGSAEAYSQVAWRTALSTEAGIRPASGWPSYGRAGRVVASSAVKRMRLDGLLASQPVSAQKSAY
jgi:hypothetical protein